MKFQIHNLVMNLKLSLFACFCGMLTGAVSFAAENPSFNAEESVYVNVLDRDYSEDHFDITFHALGRDLRLFRSYSQSAGWEFDELFPQLFFERSPGTSEIVKIDRDNEEYIQSGASWVYGFKQIEIEGSGFKVTDNQTQEWELYSATGRIQSFGRGAETLGLVTLDPSGRLDTITRPDSTEIADIDYNASGRIIRAENHAGAFVEYTWDNADLTDFLDIRGSTTTYTYTGENITRKDLPGGIVRLMTYNSTYGDLLSITDETGWGRFYEYSFDNTFNEFYVKITHSSGRVEERFYNSAREIVRIKVNGTVVREVDYLDNGNRVFITDGLGNVTEELYLEEGKTQLTVLPDGTELKTILAFDDQDGNFRRIREIDGRGYETRYGYDVFGRITSKIDAEGSAYEKEMRFTYDANGNLKTSKLVGDSNTLEATTVYNYDNYGRLISVVDPEGNTTSSVYDDFNREIESIDGVGESTTYTYDDATGDLLETMTPLGITTTYTYDVLGRMTSITNGLGDTLSYIHEKFKFSIEDPNGNLASIIYDRDGRAIEKIDPAGITSLKEYDDAGRVTKVIDENGNVTESVYNENMAAYSDGGFDVLEKIIYPTFEREFIYDSRYTVTEDRYDLDSETRKIEGLAVDGEGKPTVYRDPTGELIYFQYDAYGKVVRREVELNGAAKVTQYVRNDLGLTVKAKMPDGKEYNYTYDRNGNALTKELSDGSIYSYSYDANNRLVERLDPNGGKILFAYDEDGRPSTQEHFYDKDDTVADLTLTNVYDDGNRITSSTDGTITITYTYDKVGRITQESVNMGNGIVMSHSKTYFANGQVKTFTGPDGVTYTYTYDDAGLLKTISSPGMGVISWNEYEWRKPTEVTYPGGLKRLMTYDGLQEIASIAMQTSGATNLFSEVYGRNKLSRVTGVTTSGGEVTYGYDEEMELTSVSSTDADVPAESFGYDLNLNRTSDLAGNTYTYNNLNSLLVFGADIFTYDANGNPITRISGGDVYAYIYTANERLARINKNGSFWAGYTYDPLGRRVAKETTAGITYYHYSSEGLVAELNSSGTVTRSYGYELSGFQEEQGNTLGLRPLYQREGGNYYFFVNDHNFRPRQLVKSDGTIVWSAAVTGFGKALVDPTSTVTCNIRLSRQYYDAESGWHYNTLRYYDPDSGRYLRPDPLGLQASSNFYTFVHNSPTYFVDPLGLKCSGCTELGYSNKVQKKLGGILGAEISLNAKSTVKGEVCKTCCKDGSCGYKGSISGSFQGTIEATYKSNNFSGFGITVGAGLKVSVSGGGGVSGSASVSCDSKCVKVEGKIFGQLTVGGYAEARVFGYGAEAFAGGDGKICADVVGEFCAPGGSAGFTVSGMKFGGEIYLSIVVGGDASETEFKISLWKSEDC